MRVRTVLCAVAVALHPGFSGCGQADDGGGVVTLSGSTVGAEAEVLGRQLAAFMAANPDVRVEVQSTPDAADQRHQLYVQWLNARTPTPDVLQLDVIWTPEFASAGWILPLDRFDPEADAFFPATLAANRWRDSLYAMPWFADVALLYWRTDLSARAPETYAELEAASRSAVRSGSVPYGFLWQGARYEGLVTVFVEQLRAFGGEILRPDGSVALDAEEAVRALTSMRDALGPGGFVPEVALTWQEEQTRLAFQNGEAAFLRNWPYAYPLLAHSAESRVAGRVAVAPLPEGPGGERASALGGQQLAINARSRAPDAAWRVVAFLTSPEQMLERARAAGQFPARRALYDDPALASALPIPAEQARAAIESAVPRPVIPVYSELSGILQVWLHRTLSGQVEPRAALTAAAEEVRSLLARAAPGSPGTGSP